LTTRGRATKLTGHWNSTLHESFPGYKKESESGENKERIALREVTTFDRVLQKRELAKIRDKLREERKKQ
jgi:hypothetical protein